MLQLQLIGFCREPAGTGTGNTAQSRDQRAAEALKDAA